MQEDDIDLSSLLPSYPPVPFNKTIVNANRTLLTKCVELEFDVQRPVVMDDKDKVNNNNSFGC